MSASETSQLLAAAIRQVCGMYAKDLSALSDAAYLNPSGGCTRSAQNFTAEVAGLNMLLAANLNGEGAQMPSEEERDAYRTSLATQQVGAGAIVASGEALAAAIEANSSKLGGMTTAPWGAPMPWSGLCMLAVNHVMYHDGQLTLLQMQAGDAEMHWFD